MKVNDIPFSLCFYEVDVMLKYLMMDKNAIIICRALATV